MSRYQQSSTCNVTRRQVLRRDIYVSFFACRQSHPRTMAMGRHIQRYIATLHTNHTWRQWRIRQPPSSNFRRAASPIKSSDRLNLQGGPQPHPLQPSVSMWRFRLHFRPSSHRFFNERWSSQPSSLTTSRDCFRKPCNLPSSLYDRPYALWIVWYNGSARNSKVRNRRWSCSKLFSWCKFYSQNLHSTHSTHSVLYFPFPFTPNNTQRIAPELGASTRTKEGKGGTAYHLQCGGGCCHN